MKPHKKKNTGTKQEQTIRRKQRAIKKSNKKERR
jgi:hypothetical protein